MAIPPRDESGEHISSQPLPFGKPPPHPKRLAAAKPIEAVGGFLAAPALL